MWMPNMEKVNIREEEEDTTWELAKAFAEDTRNTHWPPKSYSCTFCRREFRSAQALGGHMNVHRRDRARFQVQVEVHAQAACSMITSPTTSLFYQLATNYSEGDSLPIISRSYVINEFDNQKEAPIEELDLELRLGHTITTKTTPSNNNVSLVNFR